MGGAFNIGSEKAGHISQYSSLAHNYRLQSGVVGTVWHPPDVATGRLRGSLWPGARIDVVLTCSFIYDSCAFNGSGSHGANQ